jgi:hypothetical protein
MSEPEKCARKRCHHTEAAHDMDYGECFECFIANETKYGTGLNVVWPKDAGCDGFLRATKGSRTEGA